MIFIPKHYQIFDAPVVLDSKDQERLSPYLSHWADQERLLSTVPDTDLMRLIVMELIGAQRKKTVARLLGRLSRAQRIKIEKRVKALKLKSPGRAGRAIQDKFTKLKVSRQYKHKLRKAAGGTK